MVKRLPIIILAIAGAVANVTAAETVKGELKTIFSEDFSGLANGTAESPATDEISASGKVDISLTHGEEWKGRGLHEAGGALAVLHFEKSDWFGTESVQGYVQTPYVDVRLDGGSFIVRFKARTTDAAQAKLHIETYDPYTTNSVSEGTMTITSEWASYEIALQHPGYGNHLAYMQIASEEEDWLLDDFEIVQDYHELVAPIVHFPRNVTFEQFTGRWNAAPLATSYLVSAFSLDDDENRVYLVKDAPTTECSMTVKGTAKGTDYYYTVKSVNDRYTSEESEPRRVHVPLQSLDTLEVVEGTGISRDGFTANWKESYRAMGYIVNLERRHEAKEDGVFTVVHEDFEKITDGDLDWPYPFYGNIDDITSMPGWGINSFATRTVKGMLGLDNTYKKYGDAGYLVSPAIDLSGDGGKFVVRFDVYGTAGDVVSVECGDEVETFTLASDRMNEGSVSFDNGTEKTQFTVTFDGGELLFIDDLYVEQAVHAGDVVKEQLGAFNTEGAETNYVFTGLGANIGDIYVYTVKAWSYSLDEDGVWGPNVYSEESAPQYVTIKDPAGIESAETNRVGVMQQGNTLIADVAEASVLEVYNPAGMALEQHELKEGRNIVTLHSRGIVIVRVGNYVTRVVLR